MESKKLKIKINAHKPREQTGSYHREGSGGMDKIGDKEAPKKDQNRKILEEY